MTNATLIAFKTTKVDFVNNIKESKKIELASVIHTTSNTQTKIPASVNSPQRLRTKQHRMNSA